MSLLLQPVAEEPTGVICWLQGATPTGTQVCVEGTDNTGLHSTRSIYNGSTGPAG